MTGSSQSQHHRNVERLDPRGLMTFRSVAVHGSFSAAARALGWTQPALSLQVRKLEDHLGVTLFTRGTHGVELTPAGRQLLPHAELVAGQLTRALREVRAITESASRTVRVVAFPSACTTIVAPAMSEMLARPATEHAPHIVLEQHEPEAAPALVQQGQADLAILFYYDEEAVTYLRDIAAQKLATVTLGWDPLQLIVSTQRQHAAAPSAPGDAEPAQLAAYASEKWVAGCPQCRRHFLAVAKREGFTPDICHASDDHLVVQELVARDLSVSVIPRLSLRAHHHTGVRSVDLVAATGRTLTIVMTQDDTRDEVHTVVAALQRAATRVLDPHPAV